MEQEVNRHGLGHLTMRPAGPNGPHTTGNAFDVNIRSTGLPTNQLDTLSGGCGLYRPHPQTDAVHFQLRPPQNIPFEECASGHAEILFSPQASVVVKVYQENLGARVVYRYRVINSSGRPVVAFGVGRDMLAVVSELTALPLGWDYFGGLPFNSAESPAGWDAQVVTTEESDYVDLAWRITQPGAALASGQTLSGFSVVASQAQDSYKTGSWTVYLDNSTAVSGRLELEAAPSISPIDDSEVFVTQHYDDFLNRQPDPSGLAFWMNEITSCGTNQQCIDVKRVNVSAAYFLSIEFQQTGYLVERIYKAAYGTANGTSTFGGSHQLPVPIIRLNEFLPDTQEIGQGVVVGQTGWEQVLENNKVAFTSEFVQRSRFTSAYATSLTPAQFVDSLFAHAGVTPSSTDRNAAIAEFGAATNTTDAAARGRALRRVAENSILNQQESNRAFVLMQYFGYLRRNPNDPQDADYTGYDFWLTKLNQFNGNFVNAEMVKAFITSIEYRQRFGP